MKLRMALRHIPRSTPIRIFIGCQTIFNGSRSMMHEKELNLKVRPYYNCEVVSTNINNGHFMMSIQ